jgi:bile acid-coenzyme A ligase
MNVEQPQEISIGAALAREAARQPHTIAVQCEGDTRTWRELHKRTNRIARGLAAKGVKFGDFLTVALPNGVGFIEACYAAWKLGAVPQPVSFRLPKGELRAIAELAQTPVVVGDADTMDAGKPVVSIAELYAASNDDSDLEDKIAPAWKAPTSGGSTGRPKLIVAGQPGLASPTAAEFWRISPDDILLMPAPLYHNGPIVTVFPALQVGARVIIMPRFDAEKTLQMIEQYRATWVYLVPTMMGRIWRLPEEVRKKYDLSSLRTVWHLAAPCPAWLKEEWINWLGAKKIWELYGGTEGQARTTLDGEEWLKHRGSVGRVHESGEIKIFDSEGRELPPGETGEVYMRRAAIVPETYRYIGAEARKIHDGWESLGDMGWFDEDGYLYLADRRSDMILVGGANVYPAEIEAALEEHPMVQSCAVIGLPDDDLGNRIHAVVQRRGEVNESELLAHLADRLVTYKRPRSIEFVTEALRDDAGKIRRSALRAERIQK